MTEVVDTCQIRPNRFNRRTSMTKNRFEHYIHVVVVSFILYHVPPVYGYFSRKANTRFTLSTTQSSPWPVFSRMPSVSSEAREDASMITNGERTTSSQEQNELDSETLPERMMIGGRMVQLIVYGRSPSGEVYKRCT